MGAVVGELTERGRRRSACVAGIPVVGGTVDAFASYLGAGLLEPGDAYDPGGSAGGFGVYWDRPIEVPGGVRDARRRSPGCTASAPRWRRPAGRSTGTATRSSAARSPPRRSSPRPPATPPGADGLVFLPYLAGERSPIWDPQARGVLAGLTLGHGRGHIARAIVEAVGARDPPCCEPMLEAGVQVTAMRACGGPARSGVWNQVKADVTGFPVARPGRARDRRARLGDPRRRSASAAYPDLPTAIRAMTRDRRPDRAAPRAGADATTALFAAYLAPLPGDRTDPAAAADRASATP